MILSLIDLIIIVRSRKKRFLKKYYRSESNKQVNHFRAIDPADYPFSYELTLGNLLSSLHFTPENIYIYKWLRVQGQPVQEGEPLCQVVVEEPDTGKHLLWKLSSPKAGILQFMVGDQSRVLHQQVLGYILYKPIMLESTLDRTRTPDTRSPLTLDLERINAKEQGRPKKSVWAFLTKTLYQDFVAPIKSIPFHRIGQAIQVLRKGTPLSQTPPPPILSNQVPPQSPIPNSQPQPEFPPDQLSQSVRETTF